jgi:hypothetical protein
MIVCKYCKTEINTKDQYCPSCNTIINPNTITTIEEDSGGPIRDNQFEQYEKAINIRAEKGKIEVRIGWTLIVIQLLAYYGGRSSPHSMSIDHIGSIIGYNMFIIIGIILLIRGYTKQ